MALAEDFMIGPTHIMIDDSCCVDKAQVPEILSHISQKIQSHLCDVEEKGKKIGFAADGKTLGYDTIT